MKPYLFTPLLLAAALAVGGCSRQTLDSARQDTTRNINEVKPQLAKLDFGARVTAALKTADLNGVRVDASTDGVTLRGAVKSAQDKARAGRIAKDTLGPDKTVTNQLTVR